MPDPSQLVAHLLKRDVSDIAAARFNADGSIDAVTATGSKHHFTPADIARDRIQPGDSTDSAQPVNHIPPGVLPAPSLPPEGDERVPPLARSSSGKKHK
jgi:hypothetical protein